MVRHTHTAEERAAAVAAAAEALRAGDAVAIPTETVYGLAANALDAQAVQRIFDIKGRPSNNPLIVHVASLEMAGHCVQEWPAAADALARAFWPGPLTMVLPKAAHIPDLVTAGGPTVGVRWPNHPVAQEIIRACGFPLAAPSANRSGQVSPTTSDHVRKSLGARVSLIVDGGPCAVGIESTVVDLKNTPGRILRPGIIHADALEAVVGSLRGSADSSTGPLRSPGLLEKHYAPNARVLIWDGDYSRLHEILNRAELSPADVALLMRERSPGPLSFGYVSALPRTPEEYAHVLYSELHHADERKPRAIVVEAVPDSPDWAALRDRLGRAAA